MPTTSGKQVLIVCRVDDPSQWTLAYISGDFRVDIPLKSDRDRSKDEDLARLLLSQLV